MTKLRILISMMSGRSYISYFDYKFNILFSSFLKTDKLRIFNAKMYAMFSKLTGQFLVDVGTPDLSLEYKKQFNYKIRKLEIEITKLFQTDRNPMNLILLTKLIYRRLIFHFNYLLYPELSGLLNESYLRIRRENLDNKTNGPVENMRLFIGTGVDKYKHLSIKNCGLNIYVNLRQQRFELYQAMLGKNQNYTFKSSYKKLHLNANDSQYHSIISNKNILLVGPANSFEYNESLLKDIDIIVLLNHRGFYRTYSMIKDKIQDKPIVSYYSGDRLRMLEETDIDNLIEETIFTVWSERNIGLKFSKINSVSTKGFRNHDALIEFGRWNFALYVLIDLLIYEPNTIHITGVDMFMDKKFYSSYYEANNLINTTQSICLHNPYEQFNLYKELYQNNKILPDSKLKNILSLSTEDYTEKLGTLLRSLK